jgi:citrate lyase beta subunit
MLFLPADRAERYPKALASGADAVCLDLEDGVSFGAKETARRRALELLAQRAPTRAEIIFRINDPKTGLGARDLAALVDSGVRPDALVLPKTAGAEEVRRVEASLGPKLPGLPLVLMIETARGVAAAEEIASSSPNVALLFFGAVDLSADLGCAIDWDALLYARSRVIVAAAAVGVEAMDAPFLDVANADGLAAESRAVRRLGFTGKAAIHPTQVPIIQQAFSPDEAEVAWARRIVTAYEDQKGGVLLVDGKLVERPVIAAARRTLAIAEALASESSQP